MFAVNCVVAEAVEAKGISEVILVAEGVVICMGTVRRFAAQMVFCGRAANMASIVG